MARRSAAQAISATAAIAQAALVQAITILLVRVSPESGLAIPASYSRGSASCPGPCSRRHCFDQSRRPPHHPTSLFRSDGENYNIGFLDGCNRTYGPGGRRGQPRAHMRRQADAKSRYRRDWIFAEVAFVEAGRRAVRPEAELK